MAELSKQVKNTGGKGEIVHFLKACPKIAEKALVLQNECLSKGTRPALISTLPFSDQLILKKSQNRFFPSDFGRLLELMPLFCLV